MLELRWLNNGSSRILQYRILERKTRLEHTYPDGDVLPVTEACPGPWTNVPEVKDGSVSVPHYE